MSVLPQHLQGEDWLSKANLTASIATNHQFINCILGRQESEAIAKTSDFDFTRSGTIHFQSGRYVC
jgi:hypothetical protein